MARVCLLPYPTTTATNDVFVVEPTQDPGKNRRRYARLYLQSTRQRPFLIVLRGPFPLSFPSGRSLSSLCFFQCNQGNLPSHSCSPIFPDDDSSTRAPALISPFTMLLFIIRCGEGVQESSSPRNPSSCSAFCSLFVLCQGYQLVGLILPYKTRSTRIILAYCL